MRFYKHMRSQLGPSYFRRKLERFDLLCFAAMASAEATVNVSVRADGESLPLFVRPRDGNNSLAFLKRWIGDNKAWIERKLQQHGEQAQGL